MSEPIDYLQSWAELPEKFMFWLDKAFYYFVKLCVMGGLLTIAWGVIVYLTGWSTSGVKRVITGLILIAIGLAPELV